MNKFAGNALATILAISGLLSLSANAQAQEWTDGPALGPSWHSGDDWDSPAHTGYSDIEDSYDDAPDVVIVRPRPKIVYVQPTPHIVYVQPRPRVVYVQPRPRAVYVRPGPQIAYGPHYVRRRVVEEIVR